MVETVGEALLISTVTSIFGKLIDKIKTTKELILDFKNVKNIDSAGIALIVELKYLGKQNSCHMTLVNIPNKVKHLCELYKLSHLIEDTQFEA